jgi:three-Cys-motif partner protein
MKRHQFGGSWTDQKLKALSEYLAQYRLIFTRNKNARFFTTIYLDGFAGTGERRDSAPDQTEQLSWVPDADSEVQEYKRGSAAVALDLDSPFDQYIFIDKNPRHAAELSTRIHRDYQVLEPHCRVMSDDANAFLRKWCAETDWKKHRAVVFLDPYGMSVDWDTISRIAGTKAIDMWLLFPLGTGINRLLTRKAKPPPEWADRVTRILGAPQLEWEAAFYATSPQVELFTAEQQTVKVADFDSMGGYFLNRLKTVFAGVAPHAMPLFNSRNNPMYLLCFAAGNPKGAKTATRIADHLLKGLQR